MSSGEEQLSQQGVLRWNITANFIGQAWNGLLQLILVPIYIHLLGAESFGLIGLFAAIEAFTTILDLGLTTTTTREVARRSGDPSKSSESRSLVSTMVRIYWGTGLLLGLLLFFLSNRVASDWVQARQLSIESVREAVLLLIAIIVLRMPVSLYRGVLQGLQKQVLLNIVVVACNTLRGIGSIAVLIFIAPTILHFLLWQLIGWFLEIAWLSFSVHKYIYAGRSQSFRRINLDFLVSIWRFAAQMSALAFLMIILTQSDRIIMGRLLPLEQLGYYSIGKTLANGLLLFSIPVSHALLPRFSLLYKQKDMETLSNTYHQASQAVSIIVSPIAATLIFFSEPVLNLWTRSEVIANKASVALPILAFGALLNIIMGIPHILQLAAGLAWIPLLVHFFSLAIVLPLNFFGIQHWGIAGAAAGFLAWNFFWFAVTPFIMHRHLLQGEQSRWFFNDTLPAIGFCMCLFYLLSLIHSRSHFFSLLLILIGFAIYCFAIVMKFRKKVFSFVKALNLKKLALGGE